MILAAILLILSFLMVALGILAELISTNRQLIQKAIRNQRKQSFYAVGKESLEEYCGLNFDVGEGLERKENAKTGG